ncbi:MAG: hypothetical protein JW997_02230 [Actinobacteria bacterium]|nr:hypothetical protein [Actinomycetota bacterium]
MEKTIIKELGEYIPGKFNTITINKLKEFVVIPYFIDWYKSAESNKIFPLFIQELSDLNPTYFSIPQILTRNPFFDHTKIKYFAAYRSGIPAGRVMAFTDYNYNKQHNNTYGWFGLFESIEDENTAEQLIDNAIDYLKKNDCNIILGPAKFNASGEIGCLVDGFGFKPYFMEPYNASYYKHFFEKYGFIKENDWYSIKTDIAIASRYIERIERLNQKTNGTKRDISSANGYIIRNVDFKNLKNEIHIIRDLYNGVWNHGNHPQQSILTEKEFDILAAGIKAVALEELLFIVEKNKLPVGVSVTLPNINELIDAYDKSNASFPSRNFFSFRDLKRDITIFSRMQKKLKEKNFNSARILILGVKENARKTGIDTKLYYETFKTATRLGFKKGSGSQLADVNKDILNPMLKIGKVAMTWRVFRLNL